MADVPSDDHNCWYLVYTKPQQERVACENLDRQGYTAYLPILKKRVRRGRIFHFRMDPLFPRYLFIRLSDKYDDWGPVRSTVGVVHLVRFGLTAAKIPDQLIAILRESESDGGVHFLPEPTMKEGDKVRFVEGSLSGYEAIFQCKNKADRVIVLMDIAGKHTQLTVPTASIELSS